VRALAAFGIRDLLLTNAAGGIKKQFRPGDFMVLTDHIISWAPIHCGGTAHFVDLTRVYDARLSALLFPRRKKLPT